MLSYRNRLGRNSSELDVDLLDSEPQFNCKEKAIFAVSFAKDLALNYVAAFATEATWKTFGGPQLPDGYVEAGVVIAVPYAIDAVFRTARNLSEQFTPVELASKTFGIAVVTGIGVIYTYFGGQDALSTAMGVIPSTQPYGADLGRDLAQPLIETSVGFIVGTVAEQIAPPVGRAARAVAGGVGCCVVGFGRGLSSCASTLFSAATRKNSESISLDDEAVYRRAPKVPRSL